MANSLNGSNVNKSTGCRITASQAWLHTRRNVARSLLRRAIPTSSATANSQSLGSRMRTFLVAATNCSLAIVSLPRVMEIHACNNLCRGASNAPPNPAAVALSSTDSASASSPPCRPTSAASAAGLSGNRSAWPAGSSNAGHCAYCAVLAEAATCWLAVVAGHVDAARVEPAARALHDAGLCWDGARLAGQAAIRTSDRKAMVSLLNCARVLQGRPVKPPVAPPPAVPPVAPPRPSRPSGNEAHTGVLSEREREVAALVVAGLTYKQVGDRLFISAKTVEHHVARMRQKLGSTSRAELFDQLRQLVRPNPSN